MKIAVSVKEMERGIGRQGKTEKGTEKNNNHDEGKEKRG